MFNSSVLYIGNYQERDILHLEFAKLQREIFDFEFDFIEEPFPKNFLELYFPSRYYREHTKSQLLSIIFEIKDIIFSDVVRQELSPIYTYVIYNMLENYADCISEQGIMPKLPRKIKQLLQITHLDRQSKNCIVNLFTDMDCLLDDFCDMYDGDMTNDDMLERLAYLYIYQPKDYAGLGANIENALDLLPKDLADLVVEAQSQRRDMNACPNYDFFISYASEDKKYAKTIADELTKCGAKVWFDDNALKVGDQIRPLLETGMINSRFGIVLVSKRYFSKYWTNQELNSLYELEEYGNKKIIPVLLDVTHDEVKQHSLFLANKLGLCYNEFTPAALAKNE